MNNWTLIGLAVGLAGPVLLAMLAPRRLLARLMVGWVIGAPLILYGGLLVQERLRGAADTATLHNALYGLALLSSVLAGPWLALSAVGIGLGLLARRILRGAAPTPPPPPAWRPAHIGFADDGLMLGGLAVWAHHWRALPTPQVALPHPAHPAQSHRHTVYEIGDTQAPVRFAADELSNGVWGFYRQADAVGDAPRPSLAALRATPGQPPMRPWAPPTPRPFAAWRSALLIFVGAIVAIGLATWCTLPPTRPAKLSPPIMEPR